VQKYLGAIHIHDMMNQMLQAMSGPMHKMIHDASVKDQDQLPPNFEERMNKMLDDMLAKIPWDEMIQTMVPAYQKHFTKGDMDALTAFYSSPVGQKILRELPAVSAESMETMMPLMQKYVEGMSDRIQQEMAEMLKQPKKGAAPARN
jgi:hypothetical protein